MGGQVTSTSTSHLLAGVYTRVVLTHTISWMVYRSWLLACVQCMHLTLVGGTTPYPSSDTVSQCLMFIHSLEDHLESISVTGLFRCCFIGLGVQRDLRPNLGIEQNLSAASAAVLMARFRGKRLPLVASWGAMSVS
jgi:hypothetical protein